MSVFLFFGLMFVITIAFCIAMIVFSSKERKGAGRWAEPGYATGIRIRLFVSYIIVFAILAGIYFLVPYNGQTGYLPSNRRDILSFRNMLSVIIAELIITNFILMIFKYKGEKNPQSKYADPEYFQQVSRKVRKWLNIAIGATIVVWLLLKYAL